MTKRTYTELSTKDLLGQVRGMIRESEAKIHAFELQAAMNLRIEASYRAQKPPDKGAAEAAKQQAAKDQRTVGEFVAGLPVLVARLAELEAQDASEDSERERAAADAASETTDELVPAEPVELAARQNGRKREPVPV